MTSIDRRPATSGKTSYGTAVVLHESSKTRVTLVPFFIPHSDRTELAVKIQTFRKGAPPNEWFVVEDKSISLQEPASRKLLDALSSHLAVSQGNENGRYLAIRLGEGTTSIGRHDPAQVANALAAVLGTEELADHLAGIELTDAFLTAIRGSIRLKEMQSAVADLRNHLDSGETREQVYQDWCDAHTWAFGHAYVMRDEVRTITESDKLDILLPSVISGFRDIVELKRPDMRVLLYDKAHKNYYFAGDTSKALGQCHRYLDVLHEVAAKGLRDHPEVVAYHPRAILVIGRSNDWTVDRLKGLHGLNRRLSGITVMTYDQLLSQGERLISMLTSSLPESKSSKEIETIDDEDDDMPF